MLLAPVPAVPTGDVEPAALEPSFVAPLALLPMAGAADDVEVPAPVSSESLGPTPTRSPSRAVSFPSPLAAALPPAPGAVLTWLPSVTGGGLDDSEEQATNPRHWVASEVSAKTRAKRGEGFMPRVVTLSPSSSQAAFVRRTLVWNVKDPCVSTWVAGRYVGGESLALRSVCGLATGDFCDGLLYAASMLHAVIGRRGFGGLRSWLVASLVAGSLFACSPRDPVVHPRVARVLAIAPSGLTLGLELDVHNPNSFALMVHSVQGQIVLGNGAVLGSGIAYPGGSIPGEGARTVSAQLDVPWVNLGALAPFALSPNPVPYVFKGNAAVGGESLNIKVPFELSGQLTREQLIAAGLRGF